MRIQPRAGPPSAPRPPDPPLSRPRPGPVSVALTFRRRAGWGFPAMTRRPRVFPASSLPGPAQCAFSRTSCPSPGRALCRCRSRSAESLPLRCASRAGRGVRKPAQPPRSLPHPQSNCSRAGDVHVTPGRTVRTGRGLRARGLARDPGRPPPSCLPVCFCCNGLIRLSLPHHAIRRSLVPSSAAVSMPPGCAGPTMHLRHGLPAAGPRPMPCGGRPLRPGGEGPGGPGALGRAGPTEETCRPVPGLFISPPGRKRGRAIKALPGVTCSGGARPGPAGSGLRGCEPR